MLHQRLPYRFSPAVNQLNHFGRKSGFEQDLHQDMNGVGNILGRLDDHRVPTEQRGKHFPGGDRKREVEGSDESYHPDGPAVAHGPLGTQLGRDHVTE
jgi:hypothetical protein